MHFLDLSSLADLAKVEVIEVQTLLLVKLLDLLHQGLVVMILADAIWDGHEIDSLLFSAHFSHRFALLMQLDLLWKILHVHTLFIFLILIELFDIYLYRRLSSWLVFSIILAFIFQEFLLVSWLLLPNSLLARQHPLLFLPPHGLLLAIVLQVEHDVVILVGIW